MSTPRTLYIVATPIGNLDDITFRAIATLKAVDLIAAEDTRHTGRLLQHFQISTPQISYHEHNQNKRSAELVEKLLQGQSIALVSDAGMPGISDPGYALVQACTNAGITVVPIPGACAAITALSAAGLPTNRFVFEGFLPAKAKARRDYLEMLQAETRTLIFYESPHRLLDTLRDLQQMLGPNRQVVLARELTKHHEEFWRGTVTEAIAEFTTRSPKGEFTLVLAGALTSPTAQSLSDATLKAELKSLIQQGLSRSQASQQLAQMTSLPRRQLYQIALTIDNDTELGDA